MFKTPSRIVPRESSAGYRLHETASRSNRRSGALVLPDAARYLPRPGVGLGMEFSMRADVETAAADIEQSIELLRRRL